MTNSRFGMSGWIHSDGTPCPEYLAPAAPSGRWWCTTHEMSVHREPGTILSPPIPWRDVPVGAVVLLDGVPRTVLLNEPMYPSFPGDSRVVLVEGLHSMVPTTGGLATVQLVMLDESDAVATLAGAGLNPEIIDTEE